MRSTVFTFVYGLSEYEHDRDFNVTPIRTRIEFEMKTQIMKSLWLRSFYKLFQIAPIFSLGVDRKAWIQIQIVIVLGTNILLERIASRVKTRSDK
jgi:hypothetical protein